MVQKEMAELLIFILVVILSFYLPGKYISEKLHLNLSFLENIFLNAVLGMAFFTLVSYFLAWFKLQILMFPLLILLVILNGKKILKFPKFDKKDIYYLPIVLLMSLIFSLTMLTSGQFGNNLRLLGVNSTDSYWHLSLINELKFNFPPHNPGFAEIPLRGYHFFFNFLLSQVSNLFSLKPISLYFHFFPLLISILWGIGVYVFVLRWLKSRSAALWAVFLTLFGGSFSFILKLQGHQGFSLDDAFGMTQPATALVNPPFAISIVFIIASIFALHGYLKTRQIKWLIPLVLFGGIITMFKVYAGMILLGGILIVSIFEIVKRRFQLFISLVIIGLLFLGTYWVFADRSAKLIWAPLWSPHRILLSFDWFGFEEKYYTYTKYSVIREIVKLELLGVLVFIIGSLGTRVVGLSFLILKLIKETLKASLIKETLKASLIKETLKASLIKEKIFPSIFSTTLFIMTIISIVIPLFFIQSGKVFEIIQMTWYFLFFSSLFASIGFAYMFKQNLNKIVKAALVLIIILVTLPSAYEKISSYVFFSSKGESLESPFFKSMNYLKSNGNYFSTILQMPPLRITHEDMRLNDWYGRESNTRVLAFAEKRGFINSQNIAFPGINVEERLGLIKKIIMFDRDTSGIKNHDLLRIEDIQKELLKNNVVFIYSEYEMFRVEDLRIVHKVFQSGEHTIYKVNRNVR